jgi:hypothetical protein
MEFFNPNFEGLAKIKKRRGLKTHTALAMIKRLGTQVSFFAKIGNLNGYGIMPPCLCSFFINAIHTASWRMLWSRTVSIIG